MSDYGDDDGSDWETIPDGSEDQLPKEDYSDTSDQESEVFDEAAGFGFVRTPDGSEEAYMRRMEWNRENGIWQGDWIWSLMPEDLWDDAWIDEEILDRAITSSAGRHLPQELLTYLASCAVDVGDSDPDYPESESDDPYLEFRSLSMVCKEWRKIIWPLACGKFLTVPTTDVDGLCAHLRDPKRRIVRRIRTLALKGSRTLVAYARVAELLTRCNAPDRVSLLEDGDTPAPLALHPSWLTHLACRSRLTVSKIHKLYLSNICFASTHDLLSLFGHFEARVIDLVDVRCTKDLPLVPRQRSSRLDCVNVDITAPLEPWTAMLTLIWTWPWRCERYGSAEFTGVEYSQVLAAANIVRCIKGHGIYVTIRDSWGSSPCQFLFIDAIRS